MDDSPAVRASCTACGAQYRVAGALLGRQVSCRRCGERFTLAADRTGPPEVDGGGPLAELSADDAGLMLGRLAVRFGMVSQQSLEQGLAAQRRRPGAAGRRIGELLVDAGLLTTAQIEFLLSVQAMKEERVADVRFGELAVRNGFADEAQVERAMQAQKRLFIDEHRMVLVGDLLVEQGAITVEQRNDLLRSQQRLKEEASAESSAEALVLTVSDDRLTASVTWQGAGERPPVERVRSWLEGFGIVHGIDANALAALAEGRVAAGEALRVAEGEAPRPGIDAVIEYLFDIHPLKAGRESENGTIDFRDRGEVPQVAPGTLLARKTPAQEGSPGVDIYGQALAASPPADPPLEAGTGTAASADRLSVTAAADGRPSVSATGIVSVYPEYEIDGDLGYETGHVDFEGRVIVSGAVQSGFHVKCGELVAGEIQQGAEVEAEGDVEVRGGVIGATVRSGGSVSAHYIHKAKLEVTGDLLVEKEILDTEAEVSGSVEGSRSRLLSSRISAYGGIFVRDIGSEAAAPSRLTVGLDERVGREIARLEEQAATEKALVEHGDDLLCKSEERAAQVQRLIGEQAQVQDRSQLRHRELKQSIEAAERAGLGQKVAHFSQELEALDAEIAKAEKVLEALFDEQDRLAEEIASLPERQAAARESVEKVEEEIERLKAWSGLQPGQAVVAVTGTITRDTVIKTPHSETRLRADRQRAWLEEIEDADAKRGPRWRLADTGWRGKRRKTR